MCCLETSLSLSFRRTCLGNLTLKSVACTGQQPPPGLTQLPSPPVHSQLVPCLASHLPPLTWQQGAVELDPAHQPRALVSSCSQGTCPCVPLCPPSITSVAPILASPGTSCTPSPASDVFSKFWESRLQLVCVCLSPSGRRGPPSLEEVHGPSPQPTSPTCPSPTPGYLLLPQAAELSLPLPTPGLVHRPPSLYTGDQDPSFLQTWTSNPASIHQQPPHFCPQLGPPARLSVPSTPTRESQGCPPQAQTSPGFSPFL